MAAKKNLKKIEGPAINRGLSISSTSSQEFHTIPVIFSLRHIQPGRYCFSGLDKEQKGIFADALFRRRAMSFKDIGLAPKEGLGSEKIPIDDLNIGDRPACLSPDAEDILVLRLPSRKGRIAGYQENNIFHVLWIDCKFDLYQH